MSHTYFPLHVHSHYSLLDGLSKCEQIAHRIEELELDGSALSDHGTIAGSINFLQKMKKVKKKPILGCELYISPHHASMQTAENRSMSHMVVLAKNDVGWKKLIKITSEANAPDNYYYKPRLSLEQLSEHLNGSIIGINGHLGSTIAKVVMQEGKAAPHWEEDGTRLAKWMEGAFGKGNFFLETQLMMADVLPEQKILTDMIRSISQKTGIPCIATPDAHYATKEQAKDQRILLCINMHTTLQEAQKPDHGLSGFFKTDNLHIPSYDEMIAYGHTEEELENTVKVASEVEKYEKILQDPVLPKFPCPDGMGVNEYIRSLCNDGWKKLINDKVDKSEHDRYKERIRMELKIFDEANLNGYFLICQDIINFVRRSGWLPGPGRGSAAGCLVSYLLGITSLDPLPYNLMFERFYNAGRNTGGRISMPDIDMDVPVTKRDDIIDYIKRKYGEDRVGQMLTFQSMKGRAALKDVFRAHGGVSAEEQNRITKNLPEPSKVADDLAAMKKELGESSVIRWALEHTPEKLSEWCTLNKDGVLEGDGQMGSMFAQAMRLEGTKSAQSRHPAGVVIAPMPLNEMCPMVLDSNTKKMMVGLEMNDAEAIGALKLDVLGVAFLDKVMGAKNILETGDIII